MHRKARSVAAGITGVALLAGVGGTFALWTDETRFARDRATLGALALTAGELSWTDVSPDVAAHAPGGRPVAVVDDFRLVPGDVLLGTADVEVVLEGDTIAAVLTAAGGDELPPWLDTDVWFTGADGAELPRDQRLTRGGNLQVHVRVGFPRGDRPHLDHQRESFDLDALVLTLRQVLA